MKVKVLVGPNAGALVHVEHDAAAVMALMLGHIEKYVEPPVAKKRGIAEWLVGTNDRLLPVVIARCPECRAEAVFSNPPRTLGVYEDEFTNSPMRNCKLEHCAHTDRIPDSIFKDYCRVLNAVQR
jgi:hypothetical protein